jgi:hypothetical protein
LDQEDDQAWKVSKILVDSSGVFVIADSVEESTKSKVPYTLYLRRCEDVRRRSRPILRTGYLYAQTEAAMVCGVGSIANIANIQKFPLRQVTK